MQNEIEFLKEEIAETIDTYSQNLLILYRINHHFLENINMSPLVNFRDALAHYVTLYESNTIVEVKKQEVLINDHLNRGYKDQILFLFHYINLKLHLLLNPPKGEPLLISTNDQKKITRKWLHNIKNLILDIRENPDQYSYTTDIEKLINCDQIIQNLVQDLNEVNLLMHFKSDRNIHSLTSRYKKCSGVK